MFTTQPFPIHLLFSYTVMSDSLPPHGLWHTRPLCPSPSPGACSNSCPLSQWCHPTTSSSVIPFSSCLQSFPTSGIWDLADPGIKAGSLMSPALAGESFPLVPPGKPSNYNSSVQFSCSVLSDCLRPHESQHARPPCPSPTPAVYSNSCPLSQWCHPAISSSVVPFSSCPQSLLAWVFSNESTLHMRWPKYWSFSFSISPFNEHPGLISFRMDRLDLPAVQGTLKSLLQHHSSKASIFQCSAFL